MSDPFFDYELPERLIAQHPAARRDESRFHEEFLLIPSMELSDFARDDGRGHLSFQFHADSIAQDRLRKYRHGLDELRNLVAGLVG